MSLLSVLLLVILESLMFRATHLCNFRTASQPGWRVVAVTEHAKMLVGGDEKTGKPILLVPGLFSDSTFFLGTRGRGFARYLLESGGPSSTDAGRQGKPSFCIGILDPRGVGLSFLPKSASSLREHSFSHHCSIDIPAAVSVLCGLSSGMENGRKKATLLGHSAGGAAILAAAATSQRVREEVDQLVVLSTPAPFPVWSLHRRIFCELASLLCLSIGHCPSQALRLGTANDLGSMVASWLRWNTRGKWRSHIDGSDILDKLALINSDLAVLHATGKKDRAAPSTACSALFDRIGSESKVFLEIGKPKYPIDYSHANIMASEHAKPVWEMISDWISNSADAKNL